MTFTYFDLERPGHGNVTRWVQPPQVAYFVTTVDRYGNMNATPVTMGTCMGPPRHYAFSLSQLPGLGPKNARANLAETPECVISYVGRDLLRQSWIAGLPLPAGISELEVAGLTPLPSVKVKPCGIQECAINLEAKVVTTVDMPPHHILYVCDIVGIQVDAEYVARDKDTWHGLGVMAIDPILEVLIDSRHGNTNLYYAHLDREHIERTPDDFGCLGDMWIGTLPRWMADEQARGKLSEAERQEVLAMAEAWEANPDPVTNGALREKLVAIFKRLVQPSR